MTSKTTNNKYAPEVRERAVRMVLDHERELEVVPVAGIEPATFSLQNRCSTV